MTIATAYDQQLSFFQGFLQYEPAVGHFTLFDCVLEFGFLTSSSFTSQLIASPKVKRFLCLLNLLPNCCLTDQEFVLYLYTVNKYNKSPLNQKYIDLATAKSEAPIDKFIT